MGKLVMYKRRRTGRGKKVPKASKGLRKVIQKEINKNIDDKYCDSYILVAGAATPYLVDTTAELVTMSNAVDANAVAYGIMAPIVQGVTEQTRIGDSIRVKRIELRMRCVGLTAGGSVTVHVVKYPQSNGAAPTIASIYTTPTDIANSTRNHLYLNDYQIIGKHTFQVDKGGATNRLFQWNKSYKGAGMNVTYDGTAFDIQYVESNNIFLVCQGYNVTDDTLLLSGSARVIFQDA